MQPCFRHGAFRRNVIRILPGICLLLLTACGTITLSQEQPEPEPVPVVAAVDITDTTTTPATPTTPASPDVPTTPATSDIAVTTAATTLEWTQLSSANGDLPAPSNSTQQTAALILDVDNDGLNDFVIGIRQGSGPSMVWFKRTATGWDRYLIDATVLDIEAGGAFHDIDADGDLDIVMGGDYQSNQIWWWENPYPNYAPDAPWTRRLIKDSGATMHHDQIFGDFDGDGQAELVFWNQAFGGGSAGIYLADIPADPRNTQPWSFTNIYAGNGEGLAQADIDGDGKTDLLAGGRWFKHTAGTDYTSIIIDDSRRESRIAVGNLKAGGIPEVIMVPGDGVGRLTWYECQGDPSDTNCWVGQDLLDFDVDHGHSLEIADINGDGHQDIFVAEMRLDGGNDDAGMWIFLGDGTGAFTRTDVATGYGNHESKVADLDGDGDLDILGKPYNWETPRIDIWLNQGGSAARLDQWQRHVIDADKPWRSIFVTAADIDGDGHEDIITGGWWYQNPGQPGGAWTRRTFGVPLNNMAAVADFDNDGDMDVLGTEGQGADPNANFVWARNTGSGDFTILDNITAGDGDFLQGVAVARFQAAGPLEVALSWHAAGKGLQMLTVPADPSSETWPWRTVAATSQNEEISAGDIDGDGDNDLLLGTQWLRNDNGTWMPFTIADVTGDPDRNRLADINGDGRPDALVGFEAISQPGKLAWYAQGATATDPWTENSIATIIGPMSLDGVDMDGDGDIDVVVGEHNTANPDSAKLYLFENADGQGGQWTEHLIHTGDEHHDGAQIVDIDGDGDNDIISIGWTHGRVLLYENKANSSLPPDDDNPPTATETALPAIPTITPTPADAEPAEPPAEENTYLPFLQALYTFEEGRGTTVYDRSGSATPLNLTIADLAAATWLPGGLSVTGPNVIVSETGAGALIEALQASNEITIEAWVTPANTTQGGPARIVTLSADAYARNITLGQGLWGDQPRDLFDIRLRTTTTDRNGTPSLSTPAGTLTTELTQVVYTRDAGGQARLYLDGIEQAQATVAGDFSNWDTGYRLGLANEFGEERPWLGEFHLVAIYSRALDATAIAERFQTGAEIPVN
jgi:hypothetical protein